MPKDVITVSNVSKMFRIPHEKKITLFENLTGIFDKKKGYEEFIALKNINFTVQKGEELIFRDAGEACFCDGYPAYPEILMMDEVLAVGDMEFQQKCLDVLQRYLKERRTILRVSGTP